MVFTSCCPLSWRSFCFRFVVVDPCFIHCHIPMQKILITSLKQPQTALWILLIPLSCQLSHATLIYDRTKLFCGVLLCFPEQLLILGDQSVQRHRCLYDRVNIRHTSRWLLISLVKSLHNAYQATVLLQQYFSPLKSNVLLTLETLFYTLFWKWQKSFHQNLCNFWTKCQIVMKFWHLTFEGWHYPEIIWIWQGWCHLYDRPRTYWVMCYTRCVPK